MGKRSICSDFYAVIKAAKVAIVENLITMGTHKGNKSKEPTGKGNSYSMDTFFQVNYVEKENGTVKRVRKYKVRSVYEVVGSNVVKKIKPKKHSLVEVDINSVTPF